MYTIVAASQKGGSGKTTLSGHLAVEASRSGSGAIAIIDTDPQGSLSYWWNARKATDPHFVKVGVLGLENALAELERMGIQIAIIDTPPAITQSISQVVAHADLVIVPTRPSPHDLRAVGATVDIAERHNKPLIFVINAATPRARITGESAVALSQHGTVAPVTIHHRVDFAASMIDGRTVGEIVPNSTSSREISDLWIYLQDKLSRIMRDPRLLPDVRPDYLSINALMTAADETVETLPEEVLPEGLLQERRAAGGMPMIVKENFAQLDRRMGPERRNPLAVAQPIKFERRVNAFGRRRADQQFSDTGNFK